MVVLRVRSFGRKSAGLRPGLEVVASEAERTRPEPREFLHQEDLDDEQQRVEGEEAGSEKTRSPEVRLDVAKKVGSTSPMAHGWRPNSATNQPSFAGEPRRGNRENGEPQQPAVFL